MILSDNHRHFFKRLSEMGVSPEEFITEISRQLAPADHYGRYTTGFTNDSRS